MMFSGRALRALPLMSALALSACGGGGGVNTPVLISPGIGIGEPNPSALVTTPFVEKARTESCSDLRNKLYVIDGKMVLSERRGNCADNSYGHVLYGASVDKVLCYAADSIAGPVVSCKDEADRALFDTVRKNLDRPGLGLDASHTVKEVFFLPAEGLSLPMEMVAGAGISGVQAARQVVVRDDAAFSMLWKEHTANITPPPAIPKVDFTSSMVLAVFAGNSSPCARIGLQRVAVSGGKLVAEFDKRENDPLALCIAAQSAPMQMVSVQRSDAAVEFRAVSPLAFSDIIHSGYSHRWSAPANLVIRDAAAWTALWAEHASPMVPAGTPPFLLAPAPQIDFSRYMVIATFMGSKPNGCYGTSINSIYRADGKLRVSISQGGPGADAICTQAITSPVHMVQLERSDEPVEFMIQTSNIR